MALFHSPSRYAVSTSVIHTNSNTSIAKHITAFQTRSVNIHGTVSLRKAGPRLQVGKLSPSTHSVGDRPVDPNSLSSCLPDNVAKLKEWFAGKQNILCLTGAGISTESGIPDYRGHNGSYHKGHKPMVHDQFIKHYSQRQRYWGRSMVGWKEFASKAPNNGHSALAELERLGKIGVTFDDRPEYHNPNPHDEDAEMRWAFSDGSQCMTIITQNVDALHQKAGSQHVTELHGRGDRLICMKCGTYHCRHDFHDQLHDLNSQWMEQVREENANRRQSESDQMRPDGDAYVERKTYDEIHVPPCPSCSDSGSATSSGEEVSFLKPDVVFFGDSVPKYRVNRCYAAVDACDGLLCIGSSLAVHSAYRFVTHAAKQKIPIAILNVGETRGEINGLDVLKIESPAGPTLSALVESFLTEER